MIAAIQKHFQKSKIIEDKMILAIRIENKKG